MIYQSVANFLQKVTGIPWTWLSISYKIIHSKVFRYDFKLAYNAKEFKNMLDANIPINCLT